MFPFYTLIALKTANMKNRIRQIITSGALFLNPSKFFSQTWTTTIFPLGRDSLPITNGFASEIDSNSLVNKIASGFAILEPLSDDFGLISFKPSDIRIEIRYYWLTAPEINYHYVTIEHLIDGKYKDG